MEICYLPFSFSLPFTFPNFMLATLYLKMVLTPTSKGKLFIIHFWTLQINLGMRVIGFGYISDCDGGRRQEADGLEKEMYLQKVTEP